MSHQETFRVQKVWLKQMQLIAAKYLQIFFYKNISH